MVFRLGHELGVGQVEFVADNRVVHIRRGFAEGVAAAGKPGLQSGLFAFGFRTGFSVSTGGVFSSVAPFGSALSVEIVR
jgi:hypothetical protein